jgi:hypothetical protein
MEKNLKILILLFYYKRPQMVRNAIDSILNSTYDNYEVAFINDSGELSSDHVLDYIKETKSYSKFKQYNINQSDEEKLSQGGSIFGKYANQAIQESDSDIVIMLCDDDALDHDYLENLNQYYGKNKSILWSYGYVKYYNPSIESYTEAIDSYGSRELRGSVDDLNRNTSALNPYCQCDASQVSFRRECFTEKDVWFSFPLTRNLDASIYRDMFNKIGWCYPNKFYTQCKGAFPDQLGNRTKDFDLTIT